MLIAEHRSLKLFELASTSTRFAAGAMTWAHSTSMASSYSQFPLELPAPAGSVPGRPVVPPNWLSFVKLGGSGRPNVWSNSRQVAGAEIGRRAIHQAGVVVGVDDGDGLARPIAGDRAEVDGVDPVGGPDLLGRVAAGRPAAAVGRDRVSAGLNEDGRHDRGRGRSDEGRDDADFQIVPSREERTRAARSGSTSRSLKWGHANSP